MQASNAETYLVEPEDCSFNSESDFEQYLRKTIASHLVVPGGPVQLLNSKKAVDILIAKSLPVPALFFIEVKYHQKRHGRLGFGGKNGGGFQPEILSGNFAYFENNLRWILASYKYPNKFLFLSSGALKKYLAGGKVGEKFNNIQARIFDNEVLVTEPELVEKLRAWLDLA